jgi:hypothetical protein
LLSYLLIFFEKKLTIDQLTNQLAYTMSCKFGREAFLQSCHGCASAIAAVIASLWLWFAVYRRFYPILPVVLRTSFDFDKTDLMSRGMVARPGLS